MPTESIYLSDVLRRLDRQDQDIHKLAREVSELKASGDAWHVEMRGTVKSNFEFCKEVITTTQATCDKMESLVKEAIEEKSKTQKFLDRVAISLTTCILAMFTYFGAPYLASNDDFWDTVWLAIKGVVKAKSG